MLANYTAFIDRVIKNYEGGYGWNKKDPGGPTKFGITCYDLAKEMGQKMDSMARWAPIVKAMTLATAEAIYKTHYAAVIQFDSLPSGVDCEVLDYAINSGVGRVPTVLRAILKLKGSGPIDAALLAAIKAQNPAKLIAAISAERLSFMHAIRGGSAWQEFGGGWGARVADLKAYSLHLASVTAAASDTKVAVLAQPVAPDLTKVSLPKAIHGTPNLVSTTIKSTVVAATGSGGVASYSGLGQYTAAICAACIMVTGGLVALYQHQSAPVLNAHVDPPITLPPVSTVAIAA